MVESRTKELEDFEMLTKSQGSLESINLGMTQINNQFGDIKRGKELRNKEANDNHLTLSDGSCKKMHENFAHETSNFNQSLKNKVLHVVDKVNKLEEDHKEMTDLQDRYSQLEKEKSGIQTENYLLLFSRMNSMQDSLTKKIDALTESNADVRKDNAALTKKIDALTESNAALTESNAAMSSKIETLEKQVLELQIMCGNLGIRRNLECFAYFFYKIPTDIVLKNVGKMVTLLFDELIFTIGAYRNCRNRSAFKYRPAYIIFFLDDEYQWGYDYAENYDQYTKKIFDAEKKTIQEIIDSLIKNYTDNFTGQVYWNQLIHDLKKSKELYYFFCEKVRLKTVVKTNDHVYARFPNLEFAPYKVLTDYFYQK